MSSPPVLLRTFPVNPSTKVCRLCDRELLLTEFHKAGKARDSRCKNCKKKNNSDKYKIWSEERRKLFEQNNTTHECSQCKSVLPVSDFDRGGTTWRCRVCRRASAYGLNRVSYLAMGESQGWECATGCGTKLGSEGKGASELLHIDHCHKTGKVRELLCLNCNHVLGKVDDNADRLLALATYLKKHQ